MRRSRYSEATIIRMVQTYEDIRDRVGVQSDRSIDNLCRMADLNRALDRLPMDLWRVMLVHGLLGVSRDDSAEALQTSTRQVSKLFQLGIEELVHYMNGGD